MGQQQRQSREMVQQQETGYDAGAGASYQQQQKETA
jgi:hypothetical protein